MYAFIVILSNCNMIIMSKFKKLLTKFKKLLAKLNPFVNFFDQPIPTLLRENPVFMWSRVPLYTVGGFLLKYECRIATIKFNFRNVIAMKQNNIIDNSSMISAQTSEVTGEAVVGFIF